MFFHQLLDEDLGCASYLIGCGGRAVVVDPGIDAERYVRLAESEHAEIATILETHTHADHVSGREALAAATGAAVRLPWLDGPEGLAPGDTVPVGKVRIEVLAAAGHRPEHVALLIADTARDDNPWLVLTGDSLLVGDLARPDLAVDAQAGASALFDTVARLGALGDGVELWPGHVGGSLCGGAGLSPKPSSTIGYERRANPFMRHADRDEFVRALTADVPPRPPTVERVVERNLRRSAPAAAPPVLTEAELAAALADDATVVIDGRPATAYDDAHAEGSLNLPLSGSGLGTRAAWALDADAPIVVAAADVAGAAELARRLRAVSLDNVVGLAPGGADALAAAGATIAGAASVDVGELAGRLDDFTVVDVRDRDEWDAGHLPGSVHLPLDRLGDADVAIPDGPLAVGCALGNRAAFATSWLRRRGRAASRISGGGIPDLADHGVELVGR